MRVDGQRVIPVLKVTSTSEKPAPIPILRRLGSDLPLPSTLYSLISSLTLPHKNRTVRLRMDVNAAEMVCTPQNPSEASPQKVHVLLYRQVFTGVV